MLQGFFFPFPYLTIPDTMALEILEERNLQLKSLVTKSLGH